MASKHLATMDFLNKKNILLSLKKAHGAVADVKASAALASVVHHKWSMAGSRYRHTICSSPALLLHGSPRGEEAGFG